MMRWGGGDLGWFGCVGCGEGDSETASPRAMGVEVIEGVLVAKWVMVSSYLHGGGPSLRS